ncbi:MAG: ClbS/DfsB family four-helix bundle protein [Caldilineaceae bacterium]
MTDAPQTIAEIVARSERAMQRVVQAIAPLSPTQLVEPRLPGDRSVKDVLAHLNWWDLWLLHTLPTDPHGTYSVLPLPLAEQIPPTNDWANKMNAKVHSYSQGRDLAVIQAEFTTTCKQLVERVSHLSIDDLYDPNGLSARIGQPVAPLVLGIYEHYEEHAHEFEQLPWS